MKRWKKVALALAGALVVTVLAAVTVGWLLGVSIPAERLERVTRSPHYADGVFVNPEPAAPFELTWDAVYGQFFGPEQREPPGELPLVAFDPQRLQGRAGPGLRATWLGHSTVLLEIDGFRILTDPVFAERASPFAAVGPRRSHPPPVALAELEGIDAAVHSHNHYDHLDEATVKHLAAQGTHIFVPLGMGGTLVEWGVPERQIHALDWWQEVHLGELRVVATPARHYSGRGLFDYNRTLWASWTLIGPAHRVHYTGDTGFSTTFADIGRRFGPFDLDIVKIGSYGPGQAWIDIHMPVEAALQVHLDLGGERMLPVHWATFNLARHAWDEPIRRAVAGADRLGIDLATPRLGETVTAGQPFHSQAWWEAVK